MVRLGDLLSLETEVGDEAELSGQDFFLEIDDSRPAGKPVSKSLVRTAREMIGNLPAEAMETYELRYGPLARKQLTEASASRDWESVRDVRRKYFHALAGYEASCLLAQREMLEGRPLAASLYLDDVVTVPRAVRHLGRSVLLMHAAARQLSGRSLPELGTSASAEQVMIDGQPVVWPSADELPDWLSQRFGRLADFSAGSIKEYAMFGAGPSRNGASSGQLPLSNERWMLDTTTSPLQEREVRTLTEELTTGGKLPPPSWVPLRVGDQLLMRTTERLVGVDYRTGKRVWTYPWQSGYEMFEDEEPSIDEIPGDSEASDLLNQRVWNDVPYGQISSDGERVYVLDDLRGVEMAVMSPIMGQRGFRPADNRHNTLVALELATEGKLRWRIGSGSDEASSLSDAFFLGPPLPLDGRLYVMVEIAGDISLCCLDPATGAELWRQQLAAVESGGIDSDPIRRVAGAMPTYHEGVMICPTGAGAIVAIDLADRMLRWGVSFDRNMEMIRSITGRGRAPETGQLMQRWYSGTAIADETAVLVTPVESDRLFGFDLLTGESLFSEKNRVHMRYLAGIRDGQFYVAGSNQIRAFDLQSGASNWTTPRDMLSAGQQIAGLGVFGDGEYLVPTTANQIVRISLKDGSVIDRRETRYPLGNLVAAEGEIISQSPTSLAVAFGEATLEPLVNQMLETNPNDFDALVRKSELLIQRGERTGALELLARARQMQPDNDEVRMLSVSAMLGELRESLEIDRELVATLDDLIDRPSQRVELFALQVRAAMHRGERLEAARRLFDLSSLVISEPLLDSSANALLNDPARQCSLDSWLAARAAQLAEESDEDELRQINEALLKEADSHLQSSTGLLKQMLRHVGALPGAETLRAELASRMRQEQSFLELERLALDSAIPSDAELTKLSNERLWMLVDAYASGGMPKDVLRVLDQLQSRGPDAETDRIGEVRRLAEEQAKRFDWPQEISMNWDSRTARTVRGMPSDQRMAEMNLLAGRQFEGWRLISETSSPLGLRDPKGMPSRIPIDGNALDMDKEAQVCGGAMVVVMPDGLISIDLFNLLADNGDAVVWQRSMSGDGGPVARRRSAITPFDDQVVRYYIVSNVTSNIIPEFRLGPIMGDRVLILQGGDLMAINLLTPETFWRNSSAPLSGAVLCDGRRVAVVSPSTEEVVFFDLLDGRKLGVEPWRGGQIWEAMGTHVLSYRETDTPHRYDLMLTNPFSGEVVLQHQSMGANRSNSDTSVPAAYGRVVGGRHFALLDNEGNTLIWDIAQGREITRTKLPAYPGLVGLNVVMLDGTMVLLPKTKAEQVALPDAPQLQTSDGKFHVTTNGVHAISLTDGSVRWGQQFEQPWGCTLTQPAETPLLLFARSPFTYTTTSRRKTLDVMAIDVRDGRVVDESEGKQILSGNNELETKITVQPTLSRIIVQLGAQLLTYSFGKADAEPSSNVEPFEVE